MGKRRKDERREQKKTMTRQKKNEMRKKASLGGAKQLQDQPDLFKSSQQNILALADADKYIDPKSMLSSEESNAEDESEEESDSDEELDRHAQMEVDLAVA